jgi:hypothetical protein
MRAVIALATTVALVGPAAATPIHKEVLGGWCLVGKQIPGPNADGTQDAFYERCGEESDDDPDLEVKANSYSRPGYNCQVIAVKRWFDPNTSHRGAWVSRATANCEGQGYEWREQTTLHVNKVDLVAIIHMLTPFKKIHAHQP